MLQYLSYTPWLMLLPMMNLESRAQVEAELNARDQREGRMDRFGGEIEDTGEDAELRDKRNPLQRMQDRVSQSACTAVLVAMRGPLTKERTAQRGAKGTVFHCVIPPIHCGNVRAILESDHN